MTQNSFETWINRPEWDETDLKSNILQKWLLRGSSWRLWKTFSSRFLSMVLFMFFWFQSCRTSDQLKASELRVKTWTSVHLEIRLFRPTSSDDFREPGVCRTFEPWSCEEAVEPSEGPGGVQRSEETSADGRTSTFGGTRIHPEINRNSMETPDQQTFVSRTKNYWFVSFLTIWNQLCLILDTFEDIRLNLVTSDKFQDILERFFRQSLYLNMWCQSFSPFFKFQG